MINSCDVTFYSYVSCIGGFSLDMKSEVLSLKLILWRKFFKRHKLQLRSVLSASVEFPCRCEEKRHRSLRECHKRNTSTGSAVSCCRDTLLGHSMRPFSVPLLSLLGSGHLTWLPGRATEGGRFVWHRCLINARRVQVSLDKRGMILHQWMKRITFFIHVPVLKEICL